MKFSVKELDVSFVRAEVINRNYIKDRDGLEFVFSTDSFASMGILAALKKNPEFIIYVKNMIADAVINLTDEDIQAINRVIESRSLRHGRNKVTLNYHNNQTSYGSNMVGNELYLIDHFKDITEPITKEILMGRYRRITQQNLCKD